MGDRKPETRAAVARWPFPQATSRAAEPEGWGDATLQGELESWATVTVHGGPAVAPPAPTNLPVSERFEVLAVLGAGASGTVYRVIDRERGSEVALKVLHHMSPRALLRFKQEFRALQDIHHPNVVRMDELLEIDGTWFLTMELVTGPDLLGYVRRGRLAPSFDEGRLRHALAQLAAGIEALHAAGRVHRDLKPSNVRVAGDRVVVLDFGLVAELGAEHVSREHAAVGTLAYMAPEQAQGVNVGRAADWYGFGAILYEALTGRWPIDGQGVELIWRKLETDPVPPRERLATTPPDLDELCTALLQRTPELRPSGAEVLARLGGPVAAAPAMPFVGRAAEQERLDAALLRTGREPAVVVIEGESGLGKSALVRQFLAGRSDVVALRGRCFEYETVPYKAFDGIVDTLARYLAELPAAVRMSLLTADLAALARVFPVLGGVQTVDDDFAPHVERPVFGPGAADQAAPVDPLVLRDAAFSALRGLLTRLAQRGRLALVIDDLQWADTESLELLAALFASGRPPPCLLAITVRPADERSASVEAAIDDLRGYCRAETVRLGALSIDEAAELAARLLSADGEDVARICRRVARAAEGHPLFVETLVRFGRECDSGDVFNLEGALAARIEKLEAGERAVLELASVAAAPTGRGLLARAADLPLEAFDRAVHALRLGHLVRSDLRDGEHLLEVFHDRIRAVVMARMEPWARADAHRRLAIALQAAAVFDPGRLAAHWHLAGDAGSAARWAEQAGDAALHALAFHRAAALYRTCLELMPDATDAPGGQPRWTLMVRLGDALAGAGRGAAAAAAYLDAVETSPAQAARELRRRAAQHLLQSGRIEEGRAVLGELLAEVGLSAHDSSASTLASILWGRARLRLRGVGFTPRVAAELDPDTLTRIDTLWAAGASFAMVDTLRGAEFQTRGLLAALDAGEPGRIARALAQEAAYRSTSERPPLVRAHRMLETARGIADGIGDPSLIASCLLMKGVTEHCAMEVDAARESLLQAETVLRTSCSNVSWELATNQYFLLATMVCTAELREVVRRVADYVREARERDDLYGSIQLTAGVGYITGIVEDRPEAAVSEVDELMARWDHGGFLLLHWQALRARVESALYRGGTAAYRLMSESEQALVDSMLLRARPVEILYRTIRGRAALAACIAGETQLLAVAARDARMMRKSPYYGAVAWGRALAAGVAAVSGDRETALAELRSGMQVAAALRMDHLGLALAWVLGGEVGGDEGRALRSSAEARLVAEGVQRIDRYAAYLVPGF